MEQVLHELKYVTGIGLHRRTVSSVTVQITSSVTENRTTDYKVQKAENWCLHDCLTYMTNAFITYTKGTLIRHK